MAKTYIVSIPIVAMVSTEVEADSEDAAIEMALQHLQHMSMDIGTDEQPDKTLGEFQLEEWEGYKEIVSGNVMNTYNHTAYAEELD